MSVINFDMNKNVASLINAVDSLLKGEFDQEEIQIDTEDLLSTLALKINKMIHNMKTVEMPLSRAGQSAPNAVHSAKTVIDLISQATDTVLDKSDKLAELAETLDKDIARLHAHTPEGTKCPQQTIENIKEAAYDIIASQSYQDVARQKLEALIKDLNQIRDCLIDALIVFNIQRNNSPENIQKKTDMLKEVSEPGTSEDLKQDLVDDLLAEFGF